MSLIDAYKKRNHITRLEFIKYRIAFRKCFNMLYKAKRSIDDTDIIPDEQIFPFNSLHFGEKLFQQYLVDSFVRIERDRINWIKVNFY